MESGKVVAERESEKKKETERESEREREKERERERGRESLKRAREREGGKKRGKTQETRHFLRALTSLTLAWERDGRVVERSRHRAEACRPCEWRAWPVAQRHRRVVQRHGRTHIQQRNTEHQGMAV